MTSRLLHRCLVVSVLSSGLAPLHATEAGSESVRLPGAASAAVTATSVAAIGDSSLVRTRAGQTCPSGSFWAQPWGVATCLQAHQVCDAALLSWQSGDAVCQGVAPAGAAMQHAVSYRRGGDGSLQEVYSLQPADPQSVATRADISPSRGYATVMCIAGTWVVSASTCAP